MIVSVDLYTRVACIVLSFIDEMEYDDLILHMLLSIIVILCD